MKATKLRLCGLSAFLLSAIANAAEPLPLEALASYPVMKDPVLSPDGRHLAVISSVSGRQVALVRDLKTSGPFAPVVSADAQSTYAMEWCHWANASRLVCGFRGVSKFREFSFSEVKLALVDADGKNLKETAKSRWISSARFDANIVERIADDPNSIIVRVKLPPVVLPRGATSGIPAASLMRIDLASGETKSEVGGGNRGLGEVYGDGRGTLRLADDSSGKVQGLQASSDGKNWVKLEKASQFSKTHWLSTWGVSAATGRGYAYASNNGRKALWEFDLEDKAPPSIAFAHPKVDVGDIATDGNGAVIGIYYETDRPRVQYADEKLLATIRGIDKQFPDSFNYIQSMSNDRSVLVIASRSDVEAGRYYLYNSTDRKMTDIGSMFPGLDRDRLARMKSVEYPAQDGTKVSAYLTTPAGQAAEKLPLVVLPHAGYEGRAHWRFDSLTQFLASRGYAVLTMNFRGSTGYGAEWLRAGKNEWGRVVYGDTVDGARWAIAQGIADPKRVCILGQGFSGYTALTAATRDSELFKCAISIGGRTDSTGYSRYVEGLDNRKYFVDDDGEGDDGRAREVSLAKSADQVKIPVLLVHGADDTRSPPLQSENMAKALESAGKPYKFVKVERADYSFWRESERKTLYTEIESFLGAQLK